MKELLHLAPEFAKVWERGFDQICEYRPPDPRCFGNELLLIQNGDVALLITRDRGQVLVDIGSKAAGWYTLARLLRSIMNIQYNAPFGAPPRLDILASHLLYYWDDVMQAMTDPGSRPDIDVLKSPGSIGWPMP
jgi:hypothetical protein